jgi:hypothetical protein
MLAPVAVNSGLNSWEHQSTVPKYHAIADVLEQGGRKGELLSSQYRDNSYTYNAYTEEKILTVIQLNTTSHLRTINIEVGWNEWHQLKNQIQQAGTRLTDLTDDLEAQSCRKKLRFDQWNSFQQQIKEAKGRIDHITEAIEVWEINPNRQNWLTIESAVTSLRQQASISSSVFGPLSQFTNILSQVVSSGIQLLIAAGVIAATALSGSWIPPAVALSTALLLAGAFVWSQLIEQEKADQLNLSEAQDLILSAWRKVKEKMDTLQLMQVNDQLSLVLAQQQKTLQQLSSRRTQESHSTSYASVPERKEPLPLSAVKNFAQQLVKDGLVNENMPLKDLRLLTDQFKQGIQEALEEQEQAAIHTTSPKDLNQRLVTQAATQQI